MDPMGDNHRFSLIQNKVLIRVLHHKDPNEVRDWVEKLRIQSNNTDLVKKYKKLSLIHAGKNSEVYRYKDRKTNEIVAVKKIDKKH